METTSVLEILSAAKKLAQQYRALTGKPLGITGEVAEYEGAHILGLTLTAARQTGDDETEIRNGQEFKLQIKGRCVFEGSKVGLRMGSIYINKPFDAVMLVILNSNSEAVAIYEATRTAVVEAVTKPSSKSRNKRGALGVSKFKSIGQVRWITA
jgi:hypothetical protein